MGLIDDKITYQKEYIEDLKKSSIKIISPASNSYYEVGEYIESALAANGDKSKLNIPFMKFELANYDMGYLDNRFLIENTTFSYNEDKNNKRDSKLDIGNLIYEGLNEEFNIKNLKLSSNFAVNNNDLKGETKISFDEFNSKYFEYSYTSEDKDKTKKDFITVKNSSLVFEYDKLPYEKFVRQNRGY